MDAKRKILEWPNTKCLPLSADICVCLAIFGYDYDAVWSKVSTIMILSTLIQRFCYNDRSISLKHLDIKSYRVNTRIFSGRYKLLFSCVSV